MPAVAVTGSAGFIGRAVINRLHELGHEAIELDFPDHNVTDMRSLTPIADASAVIHLAGVLGTAELWGSADTAIDVNVRGALNVLTVCRLTGAAFVGITMPDCWANVYQATKQCAQTLALGFHQDFGVSVTHIRAFNAYGAGQKHGPGHPQKIIPTFATKAFAGEPIPIWGDGLQTVDLVHVDHIARCLVDAAVSPSAAYGAGQVWDAGSGVETSVVEVARRVSDIVHTFYGVEASIEHRPMRAGETPNTRLCATRPGPEGFDESRKLKAAVMSYAPAQVCP